MLWSTAITPTNAVLPALASALPAIGLGEVIAEGENGLALPEMEAELRVRPYLTWSTFSLDQWRELSQRLARQDFREGAREYFRAAGLHRQRLIWSDFVGTHQKMAPPNHPVVAREPWQHYLQERTDFISDLQADIRNAGLSVEQLMALIKRDRRLSQQLLPYEKRTRERFNRGYFQAVLQEGCRLGVPLPFPLLAWLAQRLGKDVRRSITLSNRTVYPNVPEQQWSHQDYPIYLEGDFDLRVIAGLKAGRQRHGVGSFGWQLWAALKDPQHYQALKPFAQEAHLSEATVRLILEQNKKISGESLSKLIRALPPHYEVILIRAYNESFHHELHRRIEEEALYPGQLICIARRPEDLTRLERFVQRPAHPARFLLGARNLFSDIPGIAVLSRQLKIPPTQLSQMEAGKVPVLPEVAPQWIRLFNRCGTPLELLQIGAALEFGIDEGDRCWVESEVPRQGQKKKRMHGTLPEHLVGHMERAKSQKAKREKKAKPQPKPSRPAQQTLISTLERPVQVERSPAVEGGTNIVYRRRYEGKLDRESIRDGEFLGELAIINHVRDVTEEASLEVRLTWPQNLTAARLALLRQQATQAAAESSGIRQIILHWLPLTEKGEPAKEEERQILYPATP